MTRLDQLYTLRAKIDHQIATEVGRMEAAAEAQRERLAGLNRRGWAECGTDGGYYRHRRTLSEDACSACKRAHSRAELDRVERRAAIREGG